MILYDSQIEVRKLPKNSKEKFSKEEIQRIKKRLEEVGPLVYEDGIEGVSEIHFEIILTRLSFVGPKSLNTIEIPLPNLRSAIAGAMAAGKDTMTMGDILGLIKTVYDETRED